MSNAVIIAHTIMEQMGRGRVNALNVMTGASKFMVINPSEGNQGGVSFKLPNNAKDGINHVAVTLMNSDTYTVSFGRVWGTTYTIKSVHTDIYCDEIANLFERETGLFVSL